MKKPLQIDTKRVAFFRFKQTDRGYFLTNDLGHYVTLPDRDFKRFVSGTLDEKGETYSRLARDFFIRDRLDARSAAQRYRARYGFLRQAPSLHIVVVTLRCNYRCVYCQANRRDVSMTEYDMTEKTARNVVDRIFESPGRVIAIEFQGGEPLLNWPVVRFIVEYARQKNLAARKKMTLSMVSNLSLMTDEIYDFLRSREVSLCTSFDGPPDLHNANRPCPQTDSYRATAGWIRKIKEKDMQPRTPRRLNALLTITRQSLPRLREIVDEYVALGFSGIYLRKLSYLGISGGAVREKIGYTAEEFIGAWRDAMEYILEVNAKGTFFTERSVMIFLHKILTPRDPSFLDIRSPCGAGVGQIAYHYNGKVYACDEARTIEDDTFLLGDVNRDDYQRIAASPRIKSLLVSSTLENFACDECVYKPYCGTCPVMNLVHHGTLFPQIRSTDACKINSAMLDYIFEKMEDDYTARIFKGWVTSKR